MSTATTLNRDAWRKVRRTGIGSSDSAAAIGAHPFKTRFMLYAEKTGLLEAEDISGREEVECGTLLEPIVGVLFERRTERELKPWPQDTVVRHPFLDWMLATPDFEQVCPKRGPGLLEAKTTSAYKSGDWDEAPPLWAQIQLQHALAVTGKEWGSLAVLIGGQRFRWFDCERNDRFVGALMERLEEFWAMVQSRTPPEVDGSLVTAKALARLYPGENGLAVQLPEESDAWDRERLSIAEEIKRLEARKTELENKFRAAIGDASFGVLPTGKQYSLHMQTRKAHEVKESSFRVLRRMN